jgi:hypothetical protein
MQELIPLEEPYSVVEVSTHEPDRIYQTYYLMKDDYCMYQIKRFTSLAEDRRSFYCIYGRQDTVFAPLQAHICEDGYTVIKYDFYADRTDANRIFIRVVYKNKETGKKFTEEIALPIIPKEKPIPFEIGFFIQAFDMQRDIY